jgi:glycosyltransferase involved in cell wall biosynthesis
MSNQPREKKDLLHQSIPLRVLHIIPSVSLIRGGPSQAILEMVKALRSQGVDAEIATTNDNGADLLEVPLHRLIQYQKVPTRFFPRFSPRVSAIREFAFSISFTTWLWKNVSQYDLLHIHAIFSYPSTVAMSIARHHQVPYIVRPLGQLCTWSLQQSEYKKKIYLQLIERKNISKSQALHLTSAQEQQEVNQLHLNTPSFVLPHGLNIPPPIPHARARLRQHLNLPTHEPILLFLSRLHPKKGLDYLIPALSKLTHHPFTFVIAGEGDPSYEQELKALIEKSGLSDRTHFAGFVAGETKNLFIQGSDLFALTSHSENFGVVVLEAWAARVPVLLTPGVALASIAQEHQLGYVSALDTNAIVHALDHYLKYPQEGRTMGNHAYNFTLKNYAWEKVAAQISDVYRSVLDHKLSASSCR